MSSILNNLNEQQRKAAEQIEGPQLILAGAGSGKTRTLTHKIAHLVDQKINPNNILAITFTNKAAAEMRERIEELVGEGASQITARTFHSLCYIILKKDYSCVGLRSGFTIYDDVDQSKLIKNIIESNSLYSDVKEAKDYIADQKSKQISPSNSLSVARDLVEIELSNIYKLYEEMLLLNNAVDFDNLILHVLTVFNSPDLLEYWQDRFKYVFVDEFQDTNNSQFELIQKLVNKYNNVCVVGDDYQAIYGWRGSNVDYIINFKYWFPEVKEFYLETNYRSTPIIVDSASEIIKLNSNRTDKGLTAYNKNNKHKIYEMSSRTMYEEADFVVSAIKNKYLKKYDYKDIAILYRTNAQSRPFEEALVRECLPHNIVKGTTFYQRKEIKDLIAFLKVIKNERDSISLERIINFPPRKVGAKKLAELKDKAKESGTTLFSICKKDPLLISFINKLSELQEIDNIEQLLLSIISDFSIDKYWQDSSNNDDGLRLDRIVQFVEMSKVYYTKESQDTDGFLEFVSLASDPSINVKNSINLMTVHASKGLEFPIVFIVGTERDVFPLKCNTYAQYEEERRLFYVAITRAEEIAHVSHAETRVIFGKRVATGRSEFIEGIPPNYIRKMKHV